jgi:hypothetical protein
MGHIEVGDVVQFAKGLWNGPASWVGAPQANIDPHHGGAAEMGKELGKNLVVEGLTAGAGKVLEGATDTLKALHADERGAINLFQNIFAGKRTAKLSAETTEKALTALGIEKVTNKAELRALREGLKVFRDETPQMAGQAAHDALGAARRGIDFKQGEVKTHWKSIIDLLLDLRSGFKQTGRYAKAGDGVAKPILHYFVNPSTGEALKFMMDENKLQKVLKILKNGI